MHTQRAGKASGQPAGKAPAGGPVCRRALTAEELKILAPHACHSRLHTPSMNRCLGRTATPASLSPGGCGTTPELGKDSKRKTDHKYGCTKDKDQALLGYRRLLELLPEKSSQTGWCFISSMVDFKSIRTTKTRGKREYKNIVYVRAAAELRIKELTK